MTWILEKSKAHSYTFNISMICEKYSHNSNLHPRFPQFMDMLETSSSFYNRNLVGSHLLCKHRSEKLISVTRWQAYQCDPFKPFNLSGYNNDTPPTTNISWQKCCLEDFFLKWHLFPRRNRSFSGARTSKFVQTCGEKSVFIINWGTMMVNTP